MKTFLPSQTPVRHIYYTLDGGIDSHGNPTGSYGEPVVEWCICWWPLERKTWEVDPIDPDVVARIESDVHMLVNSSEHYTKGDRVLLDLSSNPNTPNWTMYEVQGLPTDWSAGLPFPTASYGMLVGAEIHLRRVSSTGVLAGQ